MFLYVLTELTYTINLLGLSFRTHCHVMSETMVFKENSALSHVK